MYRRSDRVREDVQEIRNWTGEADFQPVIVQRPDAKVLHRPFTTEDRRRILDRAQQVGRTRCRCRVHCAAKCRDEIRSEHRIAIRPAGLAAQRKRVTSAAVFNLPGNGTRWDDFAVRTAGGQPLVEITQDVVGKRVFRALRIQRARLPAQTTPQHEWLGVLAPASGRPAAAAGSCQQQSRAGEHCGCQALQARGQRVSPRSHQIEPHTRTKVWGQAYAIERGGNRERIVRTPGPTTMNCKAQGALQFQKSSWISRRDRVSRISSTQPVPTDASGRPVPTEASGRPVPTDASGLPVPTDASGRPVPTDASGRPVPTDASGLPVPTDASGLTSAN